MANHSDQHASPDTLCAADRKARFIDEITKWTSAPREARVRESMGRQDLAALDSLQRLIGQRQSLIENLSHLYRSNPQADVAPGLLALITFLSDNDQGCCTLGVGRMAQIFSRHERRVREGLKRLKDNGCIRVEDEAGKPKRYWPVVNRLFGDPKAIIPWFVDAHSPSPAPRGRPKKNQAASVIPFPGKPWSEATAHSEKPGRLTQKPRAQPSTESTRETTEEDGDEERDAGFRPELVATGSSAPDCPPSASRALAVLPEWLPTPEQATEYQALAFKSLSDDLSLEGAAIQLRTDARALQAFGSHIIATALAETFAVMSTTALKRRDRGAFANYFRTTWRSKCNNLRNEEIEASTRSQVAKVKVETERYIGTQRVAEFQKTAEAGYERRQKANRTARTSVQPRGNNRYTDEATLLQIGSNYIKGAQGNIILDQVPGATRGEVDKVFLDVSKTFAGSKASLAMVIDQAIIKLVHQKHGTPADFAGGPAASFLGVQLSSVWALVTPEKLAAIRMAHPEVPCEPNGPHNSSESVWLLSDDVGEIWREVEKFAEKGRASYGNGLQKSVEDEFERLLVERFAKRGGR